METMSAGKMDNMPPLEPKSRPRIFRHKPFDVSDVRSKFVSSLKISAKKLYKQFKLIGDNKLVGPSDRLIFSLSNTEISISSLVTFSSPQMMEVLVQTNEPISFGVANYRSFRRVLSVMSIGKEIDGIVLAYQPEEKTLILADAQGTTYIRTIPCTPKEINESLLHLKLNN
ncbi:hypothetical protein MKW92_021720 [Papaver armeniacum]|nr:hypothetical protein MKW92_021720 [Papaver armeniacum]